MKKHFLRVVLAGVFTLSIGVAGALFTVASVGARPLLSCGGCSGDRACMGTPCTCQFDGGSSFHCVPPVK
jgi:hypothetical protein